MCTKTLLLFSALLLGTTQNAFAILVTVSGTDYEIETVEGSFTDLKPLLKAQDWWGDSGLAFSLAAEVDFDFGTPNLFGGSIAVTPYAAWDDTPIDVYGMIPSNPGVVFSFTGVSVTDSNTFLVESGVSAVPEASAFLCVGAITAGIFVIKRRNKRNQP